GFADAVGDYQRQMFLMDHAGLPVEVVLEQIEMLGSEVVPVLREEFESRRPADVPSDPPTHASLIEAGDEHANAAMGPRSRVEAGSN
ncbi:MAG: 5,10-methylene tetrahydromethanopterin reductase, partial [Actinomycetales bacterium]|nr:5,10-methylene tetrahydromethanopterin reductase [Actinomycetales bacterium]